MNEIQVFKNEKLNLKVRVIQNEDGSISINAEDSGKGLGFIKIDRKNGKEYTRVDMPRIQKYIVEVGFGNEFPNVSKDDFIPESLFYLLAMKANNKVAQEFQKWLAVEVIPQIRKTGGYIPIDEEESEKDILAKAFVIAQNTLKKKDELLKAKDKELESKNRFLNQISASQNSLKVEEVAQIASKEGIKIGRNRLWDKLREWGLIKKNSKYDPKQEYIDRGYFEVIEGTKENSKGVFTYKTTRVLGKGQVYIIDRLLKEQDLKVS